MGGDEMFEEYKTRMKYDKLFSFMIGKIESQSLKVIMDNGYNVSAILRKSINDIAERIELEKNIEDL